MKDAVYGVFSFSSPHHAIAAEQIADEVDGARVIPVPPEVSAGCGLALRVKIETVPLMTELLQKKGIPFDKTSKLEIINKKRIVSEM